MDREKYRERGCRVCSSYKYYKDFYESAGSALTDDPFFKNVTAQLDGMTESILKEMNAPGIPFLMDPESHEYIFSFAERIRNSEKGVINLRYSSEPYHGYIYILNTHVQSMNDSDDFDMECILLRRNTEDDSVEMYSHETEAWNSDDRVQRIYNVESEKTAELGFIYGLEEYTGKPVYLSDLDEIDTLLDKNTPVILLANELHGVGKLKLMVEYETENGVFNEKNLRMVLTCADRKRRGACVFYENSMYHICQMDLGENEGENLIMRNIGPAEKGPSCMFEDIAKNSSVKHMTALLLSMWDHYNCGKYWNTIPVSAKAYINYSTDADPDFTAYSAYAGQEITGKEKNEIECLKDILQSNRE